MPGAVPERLFQSISAERGASRVINRARPGPGPNCRNRSLLSLSDGYEQTAKICACIAELNRPGKIHAVSVVDAAKVQHHPVPFGENPRAGTGVRQGAIRPRGNNSLKRGPLEAQAAQHRIQISGDLHLGSPRPGQRRGLGCRTTEPPSSFSQRSDLGVIFHHSVTLDDPFRRDERRTSVRALKRCRRRPGQSRGQPVEPADRHRRGLDPDAPRASLAQDLGERLVVTPRRHDDGEVVGEIRSRSHEAPRHGLIPEVDDEHARRRCEDDQAGGADKSGEIADVGQVRHDERVDGGGAHALPGTIETGNNRGNATVHLQLRVQPGAASADGLDGHVAPGPRDGGQKRFELDERGRSGVDGHVSRLYRNADRRGRRLGGTGAAFLSDEV